MSVEFAFDEEGLLPAVAQDADSGDVLMLAYVTREAVARTRETGYAHYHSRSRDALWKKGEESGHTQRVEEVRVDCDGDAFLYRVHQAGAALLVDDVRRASPSQSTRTSSTRWVWPLEPPFFQSSSRLRE